MEIAELRGGVSFMTGRVEISASALGDHPARLLPSVLAAQARFSGGRTKLGVPSGADPRHGEDAAEPEPLGHVTLVMDRTPSVTWLEGALEWMSQQGIAIALRFARVLPRELIAVAASHQATFEIELFHVDQALARVLSQGAAQSSLGSLLVQAQHLLALNADVVVRVACLMPTVLDAGPGEGLTRLLSHVAAARLKEVEVRVARLDATLAHALRASLGDEAFERLLSAYGQPHYLDLTSLMHREALVLPALERAAYLQEVRALAARLGLELQPVGRRAAMRASQARAWSAAQQSIPFARGA